MSPPNKFYFFLKRRKQQIKTVPNAPLVFSSVSPADYLIMIQAIMSVDSLVDNGLGAAA